ncbi:uncharacterized protein ARMOST_14391 [Armillaria ostoyae]|uniref:Uncharacterized protein n=1 Tax=Armillaria ostoyae TaxID=47428 RepID=A0A284RQG5_ARMOS|nr:uncharacterized protein ARMOST_14391 [Armillaria ostoyae]
MTRFQDIYICWKHQCSFCSRDIYGRGCSCPKVVDNAMILCSSCERYQRGCRLLLYPFESSITDTVVVETLRNPIGWEIAREYDEKPVDAHVGRQARLHDARSFVALVAVEGSTYTGSMDSCRICLTDL